MEDLLEEFVPCLYRFALRLTHDQHLAEDLTQETILRAWRRRKELREQGAFRVWLYRIAVNLWRDHLRRSQYPPERAMKIADEVPDRTGRSAECGLAEREQLQRAIEAMNRLPERQRQVLYLCACEEFSLSEAATVLGVTVDAAKASLSLARKKMRAELKGLLDDISQER